MMQGCQICTGANSTPLWLPQTREARKLYALVCDNVPPVIASVLNSRVLAPKAPEPVATQPSAAAVNVWSPVSSLPVSACQLPASPVPVQARKGVWGC